MGSKVKVDAALPSGDRPIKMTQEQERRCRDAYLLASRVTGISEDKIHEDRDAYRQYQREWAISEAARLATIAPSSSHALKVVTEAIQILARSPRDKSARSCLNVATAILAQRGGV